MARLTSSDHSFYSQQEDEKNNPNQPPKYAKTVKVDNYHYHDDEKHAMYPRSEQAHYRGSNRREIRADPHSLQSISSQLPRRPKRPYYANPNDGSNLYSINVKSNSAEIKFKCEKLIKYDIEFDPFIAEDAKELRRSAIKKCEAQTYEVYGFFFDDNTRVYAVRSVKEKHQFYYDNGTKKIILKFGQILRVQDLDLQYKKV